MSARQDPEARGPAAGEPVKIAQSKRCRPSIWRELVESFAGQHRIAAISIVLGSIVGCTKPVYLEAKVPEPCTARDVENCLGWMAERDLHAAELEIYEDVALERYVQSVADRLARNSLLRAAPRVMITDRSDTYATSGHRVVIARQTIEKLGSEAELAAVLAHELVHLEGKHSVASLFGGAPDPKFINRRDAESVADERGVWLLERAGYAPTAMRHALRAVLEAEDEEHPLRADRIARVTVLAGNRGGVIAREEFLTRLANMVVGRDPRLGTRVGNAWVVSALGVTLALQRKDDVRGEADVLALRRDDASLIAYAVGAPWGRELAAQLEVREVVTTEVGDVTLGTTPFPGTLDNRPLAKLARAVRASLPQPTPGSRVAILVRPRGALVVEIEGNSVPDLLFRAPTEDELAAVEPARIVIARAPKAGTLGELGVCADLLDDPGRRVIAGDPIKCASRP